MPVIPSKTFKARKWPIILIYVLTGGPFFIYLKLTGDPKGISDFMIPLTVGLSLVLYLVASKMMIVIDNENITYKSLFKTTCINWENITHSKLSFEIHGHSGDIKWLFTDENENGIAFSLTYFSRSSNEAIANALISKCVFANISDKVKNMAIGKFPWYIF